MSYYNKISECKRCGKDISDSLGDSHCESCKNRILEKKNWESRFYKQDPF